MAQQHQTTNHRHQPNSSSAATSIILTSFAMIAVGYLGFVRPAQEHMQLLERQCNKLVIAVKKLQSKDDTARHGLRLISLLEAQTEKMAHAERAVAQFTQLRERMVEEADEMIHAIAALQQLEDVRAEVAKHHQTLDIAAENLNEIAEVAATITASGDLARQANGSLATLGEQQVDISNSISKLSRQLLTLEAQLNIRSRRLPAAEATLVEVNELCQQLALETAGIREARQQLSELAGLKQEVLDQASNVPAAEAALDQIWDLKDGLLQANNTLDKAKQLAVDMMLLEPVLDQLAKTLQPSAEATRLSRREAAKTPKTRQTASVSSSPSPWSSALNVFVALLNSAK